MSNRRYGDTSSSDNSNGSLCSGSTSFSTPSSLRRRSAVRFADTGDKLPPQRDGRQPTGFSSPSQRTERAQGSDYIDHPSPSRPYASDFDPKHYADASRAPKITPTYSSGFSTPLRSSREQDYISPREHSDYGMIKASSWSSRKRCTENQDLRIYDAEDMEEAKAIITGYPNPNAQAAGDPVTRRAPDFVVSNPGKVVNIGFSSPCEPDDRRLLSQRDRHGSSASAERYGWLSRGVNRDPRDSYRREIEYSYVSDDDEDSILYDQGLDFNYDGIEHENYEYADYARNDGGDYDYDDCSDCYDDVGGDDYYDGDYCGSYA